MLWPRGSKLPTARGPRGPRRLLLASALLVGGCGDAPQVRVYEAPADGVPAPAAAPPAAPPLAAAAAESGGLHWQTPAGYRDTGESNQFRTATLKGDSTGAGEEVEVAISRVPGQAGGIAANVNRWRGQLGLPPVDRGAVIAAVSPAPTGEGGLPGMVVTLANADATPPAAQRIAWFVLDDATWYVKATGTPAAIERETPALDRFLASLRPADAAPADAAAPSP
ncbi:hypothetical protein [Phycisphaera mikurensis]|nr:hypothetical protein [Phycisphaera mikurensis]MBB6441375.1 hypothetical protein [Phycisphaera mikurensis]